MPMPTLRTAACALLLCAISPAGSAAASISPGCYEPLSLTAPPAEAGRALYILVDQATPLNDAMRNRAQSLLGGWGRPGDRVKIVRFAANVQGHFTEPLFAATVEANPGEEYLYNLRDEDQRRLLACLENRRKEFQDQAGKALATALAETNPKLTKSDLFYWLNQLAGMIAAEGAVGQKNMLIVTNGLENSATARFRRGAAVAVPAIDPLLAKLRKGQLLPDWGNANVYVFGLGSLPDSKTYVAPQTLEALKEFWRRYFVAGKGRVKGLGTPALLAEAID